MRRRKALSQSAVILKGKALAKVVIMKLFKLARTIRWVQKEYVIRSSRGDDRLKIGADELCPLQGLAYE